MEEPQQAGSQAVIEPRNWRFLASWQQVVIVLFAALAIFFWWESRRSRYSYVKESELQYRVDERSGRTDVLLPEGRWEVASFDRPPVQFSESELRGLLLTNGTFDWEGKSPDNPMRACFDVENGSSFVLGRLKVLMTTDHPIAPQQFAAPIRQKYPGAYKDWSDDQLTNGIIDKYPAYKGLLAPAMMSVTMTKQSIFLLAPGQQAPFCGDVKDLVPSEGKSGGYKLVSAEGWKR